MTAPLSMFSVPRLLFVPATPSSIPPFAPFFTVAPESRVRDGVLVVEPTVTRKPDPCLFPSIVMFFSTIAPFVTFRIVVPEVLECLMLHTWELESDVIVRLLLIAKVVFCDMSVRSLIVGSVPLALLYASDRLV